MSTIDNPRIQNRYRMPDCVYSAEELKRIQKFREGAQADIAVGALFFSVFTLLGIGYFLLNRDNPEAYKILEVGTGWGLGFASPFAIHYGITKHNLDSYRTQEAAKHGGMFVSRRPARLFARMTTAPRS